MPVFQYEAATNDGAVLKGRLDAADQREATRELRRRGLIPVDIAVAAEPAFRRWFKREIGPKQHIQAITELATLVDAGVQLGDALATLSQRDDKTELASAFSEIDRSLRRGRPLEESLRAGLPGLPNYVFQLAAAGSETGELGAALKDAAAQMEYQERLRQDIKSALIYPSVLVLAGIAAVLFIFVVVVPRFSVMFAGKMDHIPWLSRVVLNLGMIVNDNLMLTFGFFAALGAVIAFAMRRPEARDAMREFALKVPILGAWLMETEIARWAAMLSKLLGNRIPLMRALNLAKSSIGAASLAEQLTQVERAVRGGTPLSRALGDYTRFDPSSLNLVRVGEQAGKLPSILGSLAAIHDKASQVRLKRFLVLIEPAAILVIGGVIGVFIVAIILAITSINTMPL